MNLDLSKKKICHQCFISEYRVDKDLRVVGLYAAFHDCLWRTRVVANIKYVAIVDFDEIIVSFNQYLIDFLKIHDNPSINSFRFQNVYFFKTFEHDYSGIPGGVGTF